VALPVALAILGLSGPASPVLAQGMSVEQGEAILQELKAIRALLERMEGRGLPSAPSAARPQAARPQTAARIRVSAKGRPALGDPDAPLTLVEFTDYQCPFCNRFFKNTFPGLKAKYIDSGKLRLVIKDLPLAIHANAREAAQAAHCAGEQGKFWPLHDTLYENAGRLEAANLPGYAARAGLEAEAFRDCLASERHLAAIDGDAAEAGRVGITATPSFVLGRTAADSIEGEKIVGALPYATFEARIEALLAEMGRAASKARPARRDGGLTGSETGTGSDNYRLTGTTGDKPVPPPPPD
jgi:protein-disulfide isomerase